MSCLVAILAICASPALAQTPTKVWVHGGVGVGTPRNGSLAASINYQRNKSLFTLRSAWSGELFSDSFNDAGLLYSHVLVDELWFVAAGTGIAYVEGTLAEGLFDEGENVSTVGLPIQVFATVRPLSWFGVGLYAFANLNSEKTYAGITFGVQLGKVR